MKTLLIVEDEKLIRQGIKTMVQRSGVPVEMILECNNGEAALEVVKSQKIDVMFTDIRMPKMDGIDLVRHVTEEVENPPQMVAISGFDDFSYAVEMMRNGVREYILKPVEREKIVEVLTKLDKELSQQQESFQTERKVGIVQIRQFLAATNMKPEEEQLLAQKYEAAFFTEPFVACCVYNEAIIGESDEYIVIREMEDGCMILIEERYLSALLKNELMDYAVGYSKAYTGIGHLRQAYAEASEARKYAFCQVEPCQISYEEYSKLPPRHEDLLASGAKLLEESARMQRLQRVGTDKTEELTGLWDKLFGAVYKGLILEEDFLSEMHGFIEEMKGFYRNSLLEEDIEKLNSFAKLNNFNNLPEYEESFSEWLLSFHQRINENDDEDRNKQKIEKALEYIKENYKNDLNMAVVSNYISMNYTMFSYCFKQYTGTNFTTYLKDVRVSEAKRLLEETDMKVIDISWEVGYENEKNFMKVFKSVCGVSPSEYRKNVLRN